MAIVPTRIDDLDGDHNDVRPEVLAFGGKLYSVDLGEENRQRLSEFLREYLEVAVEIGDAPTLDRTVPELAALETATPAPTPAPRTAATKRPRKARKAATSKAARTIAAPPVSRFQSVPVSAKELRQWGNENGMSVSPNGAIPRAVRQAYDAAH